MNQKTYERPAQAAVNRHESTGPSVLFDTMMIAMAEELTKDLRADLAKTDQTLNNLRAALREKAVKEGDHEFANHPALRDTADDNRRRSDAGKLLDS